MGTNFDQLWFKNIPENLENTAFGFVSVLEYKIGDESLKSVHEKIRWNEVKPIIPLKTYRASYLNRYSDKAIDLDKYLKKPIIY